MENNQTGETPIDPSGEREEKRQKPERIHFNPMSLTEEEAYWAAMWYEDDEGRKHQVYWGRGEDFPCPAGWQSIMATRKRIQGVHADVFIRADRSIGTKKNAT